MVYDNPRWEFHLPINPPINPGKDIDVTGETYVYDESVTSVALNNWWENDRVVYRPRMGQESHFRMTLTEEVKGFEYDCE